MATRFAPGVEEILGLPGDGNLHELVRGVHHVSWVHDPRTGSLRSRRFRDGRLVQVGEVGSGGTLETDWPWSLSMRPEELF